MTTLTDRIPALGPKLEAAGARLADCAQRVPPGRGTYARVVGAYALFMTVWIYGFAAQERGLPGLLAAALLILPAAVHLAAGFALGRLEALYLAVFPPALALLGPGIAESTVLAVTLVILMIFPGTPLLLAGQYVRRWVEPDTVEDWF